MAVAPAAPAPPGTPAVVAGRRAGIEVGAGFAVDLPDEPRWARVGASLRLGVVLGALPLALQLDGAITSHTSSVQRVGAGNATFDSRIEVWDVPIGLGLLYRLERGRFLLAVGPRVSLHVVHASADAGLNCPTGSPAADCSGSRTALSAGAGAVVEGRLELARRLWAALSIGAEALLPEQTFTTASVRAADLGSAQVSFVLGLVWRAY